MSADIEVVEFAPDRLADYFRLFDTAFRDNPEWDGCYCAFYDVASDESFSPDQDAARHRADREARLRSGTARGLLAYVDGAPVGWCNVAPRSQIPNLRKFAQAIEAPSDDPAVIMCFVIDPDWRGRGVATALLGGAIDASRGWGVPWLEAYPAKADIDTEGMPWTAAFYKGPLSMYRTAGFSITRDMGTWYVVRHDLAAT
jgi:GNAT superfamily N-acetyltransferase